MLAALSLGAYLFFARSAHEALEPLLALPEGQASYAATMRRVAITIALFDLPLIIVVGLAAFVLARVSVRPLVAAREREERFAADAAHELRTPLATIAAVAQAAQAADSEARVNALKRITEVALEASGLLADLMMLMRDAPAQSRLDEPVDLAALIEGIVRDAGTQAASIGVATSLPKEGAYVIGDVRALRQLATNLIDNALRHARSKVEIGIACEPRSIVLWVEDDGPGVTPLDRERIFERFFKSNPNSPGSGLGLAIARHIAVRHGGTLELLDTARFVACFPRAPV